MITRSISISNWRCFLNQVTFGPFSDGLNIVYGPNGMGKSTLFEALRITLLDGHRITGRDIEAIRPWGRSLAPKVIIEFAQGGIQYRIAKQFIDNPNSLLERRENGRYSPLASGTDSDVQTREILTRNPPGRGISRLENWGLAQILWVPQGQLVLKQLSSELVNDIQSILGSQLSGTKSGPIEALVKQKYDEYFSAKGKPKTGKGAPLFQIEEKTEHAKEESRKAHEIYSLVEESSLRVQDLQSNRHQAKQIADEIEKILKDTRQSAEKYQELVSAKENRESQAKVKEAEYQKLKQHIDLISNTETEHNRISDVINSMQMDLPAKDKELMDRARSAAQAKADLEDIRKRRKDIDEAREIAELARQFNDCQKELQASRLAMDKIKQAQKLLEERKNERGKLVAPDTKMMRSIRKTFDEFKQAKVQVDASLINLEIVPQSDVTLEILNGYSSDQPMISAGAPALVRGSPEIAVNLTGISRIRAWGPTGSIDQERETLHQAEMKLEKLIQPFGSVDMDSLELLHDQAKDLDSLVSEANTQLDNLLLENTEEDIQKKTKTLEASEKHFLVERPDWSLNRPNFNELKSNADTIERAFIKNVEEAEDRWTKAQSAHSEAVSQHKAFLDRLESARKDSKLLLDKLQELKSDGKNINDRKNELQQIALMWDAAKGKLSDIINQLNEYQDNPILTVKKLETQLNVADDEATRLREKEIIEETKLQGLLAQGPYSLVCEMDERLTQLEKECQNQELRANSIRLLWNTICECRVLAVAAVSQPVVTSATRTFQRIIGRKFGTVGLGDSFEPTYIVPDQIKEEVPLWDLSGGEQEQLFLAVRLALAEVVGKEERQLVILDDVLTATDTGRLARILNILEESSQRLQIIILTCHPERYRGLKEANFFDVEGIVNSSRNIEVN